jgi:murein L,D-transpeptidase YcbB/YkuD
MAEYLLRNHPDWPPEKIRSTLTGSDFSTRTVELEKPVNIHILYWTARVDDEGHIHFQPDIYNRDTVLDAALQLPPPQPLK